MYRPRGELELVTSEEAERMIALRERLSKGPDAIPLDEVALAMGVTDEEANALLLQVRAETGMLSPFELDKLRRPPRIAVMALVTIVATALTLLILFQVWDRWLS